MDNLKEILPTGRDVVDSDGNVRSRADFPRDEYPEPEVQASEDQPVVSGNAAKRRRGAIHRGGRATVEAPSGREDSRRLADAARMPDTEETAQSRAAGIAAARAMIAAARQGAPVEQTPPHDPEEMKRKARESWGIADE